MATNIPVVPVMPPRPEKVARVRSESLSAPGAPQPPRKRTSSGVFQVDETEPPPKKAERARSKSDGALKKSKGLTNGRRKSREGESEEGKERKIIHRFDSSVKTTCVTAFQESDSWD